MLYNNVDIVHCIDVCERMMTEIERVKQQIKLFNEDLMGDLSQKSFKVASFRTRLIVFSDAVVDWKDAVMVTDFYELPREEKAFLAELGSISCSIGGGDDYNNGLEALAYAIQSNWKTDNRIINRHFHFIVIWSNGRPRPLGTSKECFPPKMARDFAELSEGWEKKRSEAMTFFDCFCA